MEIPQTSNNPKPSRKPNRLPSQDREINLSKEFSEGKIQQYCQDIRFTWLNTSYGCYDEKTLVFTNQGWKYFKDLKGNELILTLNPKTKQKEWQKAKEIFQIWL